MNCRRDPALPYLHRDQEPEVADAATAARRRLLLAERELGREATIERIAEFLDVSPRTVRRWREMAHG